MASVLNEALTLRELLEMMLGSEGKRRLRLRHMTNDQLFQLYDEHEMLSVLENLGMKLIESEAEDQLGDLMFFADPKHARHCVFYMRKL